MKNKMQFLLKKEKCKYWMDLCIIFFVCFIPKFLIAKDQIMVNTLSDEVSSISVAAFVAGYDWRDVVSNAGYYGVGYLFLFFPLFKIGLPAMQIYKIILGVNAVLIGMTGIVCYQIQKNIFGIESRIAKIIIACVCGCMSIFSVSTTRARNEDIYLLCGWLVANVLLKLLDCHKVNKKKKYELQLVGLILYMLTIHTRSIIYIISMVLICIIYYILFGERVVSRKFWCYLFIGYLIVQKLLDIYQKWVWSNGGVRNASISDSVTTAFSKLSFDMDMVKSVLMIIFGQFFTAFSLSGGIFLICIVLVLLWGYRSIKYRKELCNRDKNIFIFSVFFLVAILISIFGQSILWGVNVYKGLVSGETDYIYSYKAFTYMRYMGSYIPQFFMIAFIIAWQDIRVWNKASKIAMGLFVPLFLFWDIYIMPFVHNTKSNMEFFWIIASLPQKVRNNADIWNIMFLVLLGFTFVWIFKSSRKTFLLKLLIIGILYTSVERMTIFYNRTLITEKDNWVKIDAGREVIDLFHDRLLDNKVEISVVDATDNRKDHQNWYLYQFMYYDLHIIPGTMENIVETDIIFSSHDIGNVLKNEYYGFQLDDNEFVYTRNFEYYLEIKNMGYEIL